MCATISRGRSLRPSMSFSGDLPTRVLQLHSRRSRLWVCAHVRMRKEGSLTMCALLRLATHSVRVYYMSACVLIVFARRTKGSWDAHSPKTQKPHGRRGRRRCRCDGMEKIGPPLPRSLYG